MKICFLMPSHWSAGLGGAEVQVKHIMSHIRRKTDHELVMICQRSAADKEDGSPIFAVAKTRRRLGRYFQGVGYFTIRRLLRDLQPDVVYTRRGTPLVGYAAQYCRQNNKRLVFHIAHVSDVEFRTACTFRSLARGLERPLYLFGLRRTDAIVAQAEYQASLLKQNYGLRCTAVIRNFHPAPLLVEKQVSPRVILWIANLKAAKRPEVFLSLARQFAANPDVQFVMIGSSQTGSYERCLRDAASLPNFRYLGKQSLEETNSQLDRAYLFVNTSRLDGEGFPNTFVQAWLRAVPVVSLDVDPDAILVRCKVGAHCAGSVVELERNVRFLLENPQQHRRLAENARSMAINEFSDRQCDALLNVIEGVQTKA